MSRALGVMTPLSELPVPIVGLFALITQLGDLWFTLTVCTLAYWLGSQTPRLGSGLTRQRGLMLLALLITAATLTITLKELFALPRPVGAEVATGAEAVPAFVRELYVSMATGQGYGFPSGHATVGVAVWGGLAWAVRVGRQRQRAAVAATAIVLILLSRLVIGVHYAVDVLVGTALSGALLWLALARLRTPVRVLALSSGVALVGLAAVGPTTEMATVVGMSVAGAAVLSVLPAAQEPTRRCAALTVGLGALAGGVLAAATLGMTPGPLVALVGAAVGTALVLVLPLVGDSVAKKA